MLKVLGFQKVINFGILWENIEFSEKNTKISYKGPRTPTAMADPFTHHKAYFSRKF